MDSIIGQTISRYKIIALLGEGGMGAVYKARDITLQRDVAMKIMHAQFSRQPTFQERFLQEARTAARFRNPNIVQVYDFGQSNNQLFIVMEYIPGDNLATMLQKLRQKGQWLLLSEAVQLVRQISLAIEYAHQNGVLHRDIKPNNVMIDPEPSEGLPYHPVITDLGLAKLAEGGVVTQEGTSMGTPAYMSPEQALGEKTDQRSDVYSLAVLLYELTVGQLPFRVTNLVEAIQYHTKTPPPPPGRVKPGFPAALETIVLKGLEKDPANRFQSAAALANALDDWSKGRDASAKDTKATEFAAGQPTVAVPEVSLSTIHQESIQNQRGDSILNDFASLPVGSQDRIQVMAPDQTAIFVTVSKGTLTIGRNSDNDIVLMDKKVSRYHARIEVQRGEYKVIDLNSANGTFLSNNRLLPGVAESWSPEKPLRVGDSWLKLTPAGSESMPADQINNRPPIVNTFGQVVSAANVVSGTTQGTGTGKIGIVIENQNFSVEPGQIVSGSLIVLNQGVIVDHFIVSLQGLPESWVKSLTHVVQLLPGEQKTINFSIQPPRKPESKAGRYPFTIKITSQTTPDQTAESKVTLTIASYTQFSSELRPQRSIQGNPARLNISNQGNFLETFTIQFSDPADELTFSPPQLQIKVIEGQSAAAEFRAAPKRPKLYGRAPLIQYAVKVSASQGENQVHNGELVTKARIPTWLPAIFLLLCLCMGVISGGLAIWNPFSPPQSPYIPPTSAPSGPSTVISPTTAVPATPTMGLPDTAVPTETGGTTPPPTAAEPATEAPGVLTVKIVHPTQDEYEPAAHQSFLFQVMAFDAAVGSKDGDGITSVDFSVLDSKGNLVYQHTEKNASYCAFGGGDASNPMCNVLTFAAQGNRWPNGTKIVPDNYTFQAVVNAASGRTQLVSINKVISPPDRIAFVSDRSSNQEIYIMDSDGSNVFRLTNDPTKNHYIFAWSHDGTRLAFITSGVGNNSGPGDSDIYVVNADGTGLKNLTNNPFSYLSVSWSPDDSMLLFSSNSQNSNRDIYVINPDGTNLRNITDNPAYDTQPHWSPDGKTIQFRSDRSGSDEFYLVGVDGSNLRQLTFNNISTVASAGFSPAGDKILFGMHVSTDQIYTINVDGGGQTNLTNNTLTCISPEWSPDGSKILYLCYETGSSILDLFVMNSDGSNQTQITSGVDIEQAQWSPDGHNFIFNTNRDGNPEIYMLDEFGRNWTRLTNNNANDFSPAFMP